MLNLEIKWGKNYSVFGREKRHLLLYTVYLSN